MRFILVLTYYGEVHGVPDGGSGRHLTLVDAGVPQLGVPDLQRPVLGLRGVGGDEALVGGVRVPADCQQVDVMMSDPRHLHIRKHSVTI